MSNKRKLSDALGESISTEEALSLIKSEPESYERFQHFSPDEQEKILAFIQGQRGLKITYDPFFKKIFSPKFQSRASRKLSVRTFTTKSAYH